MVAGWNNHDWLADSITIYPNMGKNKSFDQCRD
jgi:hypothetical protein